MNYSYLVYLDSPSDNARAEHEYDSFSMALHLHYCDSPIQASSRLAEKDVAGVIVTLSTDSESAANESLLSLMRKLNKAMDIALVARKLEK
jgi:hypothetical protein